MAGLVVASSRRHRILVLAGAGAVAALLGTWAPSPVDVANAAPAAAGARALAAPAAGSFAEHRYRVLGKLRLALFWIGRDNVGSARLTWRSDGRSTVLALLIGSDPERAPRNLNQWGYVREESHPDKAEVFTLRSLTDDAKEPSAPVVGGGGPLVGVSCSSMRADDVNSLITTINGRGMTYRMFDRLLDEVAVSSEWKMRRTPRPPGADAGFLTALQHMMRAAGSRAKGARTITPVTYIYNNTVYDLGVRDSHALGRTMVGTRTFEALTQTDFSVRNRTTGEDSRFAVTYAPDGVVPLPVQIFYRPSFWLSIELRLDDTIDVPTDPAADGSVLTRIRTICGAIAPLASDRD